MNCVRVRGCNFWGIIEKKELMFVCTKRIIFLAISSIHVCIKFDRGTASNIIRPQKLFYKKTGNQYWGHVVDITSGTGLGV